VVCIHKNKLLRCYVTVVTQCCCSATALQKTECAAAIVDAEKESQGTNETNRQTNSQYGNIHIGHVILLLLHVVAVVVVVAVVGGHGLRGNSLPITRDIRDPQDLRVGNKEYEVAFEA
jgi:ABC-type anion transport system duplicated permease subunit